MEFRHIGNSPSGFEFGIRIYEGRPNVTGFIRTTGNIVTPQLLDSFLSSLSLFFFF